MELIARTGFYVSTASYAVFWIADVLRPGFVARSFSVHLFLLAAIAFGIWWGMVSEAHGRRRFLPAFVAAGVGIVFCVAAWQLGEGFDEYRLLFAASALFIPNVVMSLLRSRF